MPLTEGAYPDGAFPAAPTQRSADFALPSVSRPLGGRSLFRPWPLRTPEPPQATGPLLPWGLGHQGASCAALSGATVGGRAISFD